MKTKDYMVLTLNLHVFGRRLRERYRKWIKVKDLANDLGISSRSAGKLLASLEKLGYVSRRANNVYEVISYKKC